MDSNSPDHRLQIDSNLNEGRSISGSSAVVIDSIRHPIFIAAWLANLVIVTANVSTFIFAEWVAVLAESDPSQSTYREELTGRVIQYGLIASIVSRLFLGQTIDRFGVRRIWLLNSILCLISLAIFSMLTEVSALLFLARIVFAIGIAGMFTSSMFHIQLCVTPERRTEFIGLLGSSGFVGMILGSQVAGLLREIADEQSATAFRMIFLFAAVMIVVYIVCVAIATRKDLPPDPSNARPNLLVLMTRYWPGTVMLVAISMGAAFSVPSIYLVRFMQNEGYGGISLYWSIYAITAFVLRLKTARLSSHIGRYRLILVGLVIQGMGLWAIVPINNGWQIAFSAFLCGFGHALLFPSIVSLGAGAFPAEYRGSGTNLTLGFFDCGIALSAPLFGRLIDLPQFEGEGFRPMFAVAGTLPLIVAVIWFWRSRRLKDSEIISATNETKRY
ncbi:MAG: MFS transporter [Fuerstiella sp.]